jgi:hypothetical protein
MNASRPAVSPVIDPRLGVGRSGRVGSGGHSGLIEATATDDPTRSDTVRYQVTTTP